MNKKPIESSMDNEESRIASDMEPPIDRQRRAEVRAMLVSEFGIDAVFVGVPKLARILGLASSTIYGYMRRRAFFIPYRMINTTPMVRLDDLVDWYCSPDPMRSKPMALVAGEDDGAPTHAPAGDLDPESLEAALRGPSVWGGSRSKGRVARM